MKTFIGAAFATFVLASSLLLAPATSHAFYPDGHDSYTGTNGR